MKTAADMRQAAIAGGIRRWEIHYCCLCAYPCAFEFNFNSEPTPEVVYDSGCDCTYSTHKAGRTWEDVADAYNSDVEKHSAFWKFV